MAAERLDLPREVIQVVQLSRGWRVDLVTPTEPPIRRSQTNYEHEATARKFAEMLSRSTGCEIVDPPPQAASGV